MKTECDYLYDWINENGDIRKKFIQNGEPQRHSWELGRSSSRRKLYTKTVVVCWLFNVPATCECISGTDLLRQFYVLPHYYRSCRSKFPSHPVTVY